MFLAAPVERSGAAGGMQGTARLAGQTSGAIIMTLLFTMASDDAAPRIGLGIAGVFTLTAGLVSILRSGSIGSYGRMSQSELSCHALGQQGH
jgi:DHA2 family multidrug resistance protein-like MFS transporter